VVIIKSESLPLEFYFSVPRNPIFPISGRALVKKSESKEIPQLRGLKSRLAPEDLISVICEEFACGREVILGKGKKKNLARDVAIYLSRKMTGETGVALGRFFGGISGAGVVVRHNYIANKIETDRKLKGYVKRIRNKIINI
jgi:chromosomal replication initiation ATPase DnaA